MIFARIDATGLVIPPVSSPKLCHNSDGLIQLVSQLQPKASDVLCHVSSEVPLITPACDLLFRNCLLPS